MLKQSRLKMWCDSCSTVTMFIGEKVDTIYAVARDLPDAYYTAQANEMRANGWHMEWKCIDCKMIPDFDSPPYI